MAQVRIKLNTVEQVQEFVKIVDQFDIHFDMGLGKTVVDAKSLLGIFSLDLMKPQLLQYDSDDEQILEQLAPFLAETRSDK